LSKKHLSERDICTKYITPAIKSAGWDIKKQVREEVSFTDGRIIVRGQQHTRGKKKRADYILYYKPNIPIALIEAKDNKHSVGAGMQQGLDYSEALDIPFVFSSNGDGFIFHDKTKTRGYVETEITLNEFPSPDELWSRYKEYKGIQEEEEVVLQEYHTDERGLIPRYYTLRNEGL
jgi:type I restriction enzyme R subunit